jgi:tetratricopeptide (TPR) repeat protein
MRILRVAGAFYLTVTFGMTSMSSADPLSVETKPTARQQLLYGIQLANHSFDIPAETSARHEAVFRAAAAFEILMLRWPASTEAGSGAMEQATLYESNLLYINVVKAVKNAEIRGITNGDNGPDLYAKEGRAHIFLRDFKGADIAFRNAETHPAFHRIPPERQATIHALIGWSYRERGDHRSAIQHYDRAARVPGADVVSRASAALEAVLECERGDDIADRAPLLSHLAELVAEYHNGIHRDGGDAIVMKGIEDEMNRRGGKH